MNKTSYTEALNPVHQVGELADGMADNVLTVIQHYLAYSGHGYRVVNGAYRIQDTLPKRTLSDTTQYAVLEPDDAVAILETKEAGAMNGFAPDFVRLKREFGAFIARPKRSIVVNSDGQPEVVKDNKRNRKLLERRGVSLRPLIYDPAHNRPMGR